MPGRDPGGIVERFRLARRDQRLAVLEGFHPLKHALRFGAHVEEVICSDAAALAGLVGRLAPDTADAIERLAPEPVSGELFAAAAPRPPSPVLAIARRPDPPLPYAPDAPLVVLDRPTHHGNVGAVVRVAAAAGAGGVFVLEGVDPWHPAALRGGAGLQFALAAESGDAVRLGGLCEGRARVAVIPGAPPAAEPLPPGAALLFGAERAGLGPELERSARRVVGIPMRPGVSSLNLATAVAVVLYGEISPRFVR
ncbi:MAG: TrmH family RNA methyltransferase [Gemmatimonadota bacterium]